MDKEHTTTKEKPPIPTNCRECGGVLQCIDEEPLAYNIYTGEVRTVKKTYACRENLAHTQMIVLENEKANFRAVIRADKWDEDRAMGRKKRESVV